MKVTEFSNSLNLWPKYLLSYQWPPFPRILAWHYIAAIVLTCLENGKQNIIKGKFQLLNVYLDTYSKIGSL